MKVPLLVGLVTSLLLLTGSPSLAQGVEQTLMDLERQWSQAAQAGDAKAIERLLATDFVSLQSSGVMQVKTEFVADVSKFKMQVADLSGMRVQVHGNAAVVTGIWHGKGTDPQGKPFDTRERFADTWVKMPSGQWQCIASAGTAIK